MKTNINLWVVCGFYCIMFALLIQCSYCNNITKLDIQSLIHFSDNIGNGKNLRWISPEYACQWWEGVYCNEEKNKVVAVYVNGRGLYGEYPHHSLELVDGLEEVDLSNNSFSGPFPNVFRYTNTLNYLNLQQNNFSGPLPATFTDHWKELIQLDIAFNHFDGNVPASLFDLPSLRHLYLFNNSLSGNLPESLNVTTSLETFSLANNNLTGNIPNSLLHKFPAAAFSGNNFSTPYSPTVAPTFSPTTAPAPSQILTLIVPHGPQNKALVGIIIGAYLLGFVCMAGLCLLIFCCYKRKYIVHAGEVPWDSLWPRRYRGKDCV